MYVESKTTQFQIIVACFFFSQLYWSKSLSKKIIGYRPKVKNKTERPKSKVQTGPEVPCEAPPNQIGNNVGKNVIGKNVSR